MFRLASAIVVLQVVGGLCFPIAKYGLDVIEPFTFAFYRYILSSLVLLTLVKFKRYDRAIERKDWGKIVLLGVLIIPFNQTLFLLGQSMTGAGHGAVLFSTAPIWIFGLALIHLGEKFTWRRALGFVIATLGVVWIVFSGAIEIGNEYLLGDLIILAAVVAWGYYTVVGKPLVTKYGALRMTAYALAVGTVLYSPYGLYRALQYDYSLSTPEAWGAVVYMAVGISGLVYVLWYWLLKYMDATRIAVYHNVQPVIAALVAYSFLGESLGWPFVVGGLAVICGVIITEV